MSRRFRTCLSRPGRVMTLVLVALTSRIIAWVPSASAAGFGTEACKGLGGYFLTMPYGGIKMAVAVLGAGKGPANS